ncbi:MAG: hypothetical protein ACP5N7_05435 [Candidatus Pacearchaeota archaeon]
MSDTESENEKDLLIQLSAFKNQVASLNKFVDQVRPYFTMWSCTCGNLKRFPENELPDTDKITCELCNIQMTPYVMRMYHELKLQFDELDESYSTALAERNRYANVVQAIIPILEEFGYNKEENDITTFLKMQFEYFQLIEKRVTNVE